MINAKMTITYISPGGRVFDGSPPGGATLLGWEKKWLLEVDFGGTPVFSEHKEIIMNGRSEDSEYDKCVKRGLVRNACNLIGDQISSQIG